MAERESVSYEDQIRNLLLAVRRGDKESFAPLIDAVGHELQKLSAFRLRRQPHAPTLQTTALVNEVVLRLIPMMNKSSPNFPDNRKDFLALTSHLMRCTLADYARKRKLVTVSADDKEIPLADWRQEDVEMLVALDEALKEIAVSSTNGELKSKAVELFLFAGMNYREIADKLGITDDMARRHCLVGVARVRQMFIGKQD
jgi:RNA polymerase sigma factor (TIGR02999 family)